MARSDSLFWVIGGGILALGGLGFFEVKRVVDANSNVQKLAAAAQSVSKETGIPVKFIVAQAAHESNYGRSGLAQKSNNLFGVKASRNWVGPVDLWKTTENVAGKDITVEAPFRKYSTWEASVRDWAKLIQDHYPSAYAHALMNDAKGFFEGLQKGGYATDPHYAERLTQVLNSIEEVV